MILLIHPYCCIPRFLSFVFHFYLSSFKCFAHYLIFNLRVLFLNSILRQETAHIVFLVAILELFYLEKFKMWTLWLYFDFVTKMIFLKLFVIRWWWWYPIWKIWVPSTCQNGQKKQLCELIKHFSILLISMLLKRYLQFFYII